MIKKLLLKSIAALILVCLVIAAAPAQAADNIYTGDSVVQDDAASTTFKMLSIPGLTKNYTFKAKITINNIGSNPWNGIHIAIGNDGTNYSKLVLTRDWGTRIDFKGQNAIDGSEILLFTPTFSAGSEFTFEIVRAGQEITFHMNGTEYGKITIPEELDAFDAGYDYNLGFVSSECSYTASEIEVCKNEETQPDDRTNLYTGGAVTQEQATDVTFKMLSIPNLTKNYTFKGKLKITGTGDQPYHGIHIAIGNDGTNYSKLVLTKDWGTRIEFKGQNAINGSEIVLFTPTFSAGSEFTFEIVRAGQELTFYINGTEYGKITMPEELDAFDSDYDYNLGFISNNCSYIASDICVYSNEPETTDPTPTLTPTSSPTPTPSADITPTPGGTENPPQTGDINVIILACIFTAAAVAAILLIKNKNAVM